LAGAITVGVGLIVMEKLSGSPGHVIAPPVNCGVTDKEAITGVLVVLFPLNGIIFPVPAADNPIEGTLFVQV
jgi:hypothetical protein